MLAYKPWAQAISQEEFEASLLPVILRMSKRSPESVVRSSANLLGMLKLDLSSCALTIVKEMLGMIRHAKETVRYSHCSHGLGCLPEKKQKDSIRSQGSSEPFCLDFTFVAHRPI